MKMEHQDRTAVRRILENQQMHQEFPRSTMSAYTTAPNSNGIAPPILNPNEFNDCHIASATGRPVISEMARERIQPTNEPPYIVKHVNKWTDNISAQANKYFTNIVNGFSNIRHVSHDRRTATTENIFPPLPSVIIYHVSTASRISSTAYSNTPQLERYSTAQNRSCAHKSTDAHHKGQYQSQMQIPRFNLPLYSSVPKIPLPVLPMVFTTNKYRYRTKNSFVFTNMERDFYPPEEDQNKKKERKLLSMKTYERVLYIATKTRNINRNRLAETPKQNVGDILVLKGEIEKNRRAIQRIIKKMLLRKKIDENEILNELV